MNRRDFLKSTLAAGIALSLPTFSKGIFSESAAIAAEQPPRLPDIVAVRGGEPELMFDRGIAAMGGMQRFVQRGQTVAIKSNASWDAPVEYAGNTNPALVQRIAQHCFEAGAREVYLFDHSIENWRRSLEASGLKVVAQNTGAKFLQAESERYYEERPIGGTALASAQIHEAVLMADVLISAPVLKHHGGATMTASMKNFMGAVWDRRTYHRNGLSQCIADFVAFRKPDLTVMDAYRIVTGNGPRSRSMSDVMLAKMQVLSTDVVAADASGARILGRQPEQIEHIRIAHAMGLGQIDPSRLAARRITV